MSGAARRASLAAAAGLFGCALRHGEELTGGPGTPPLKGPEFQFTWKGKSAAELAAFVKEKMPPGGADPANDQQTADLVALVLKFNGLAAGNVELGIDAAAQEGVKIPMP